MNKRKLLNLQQHY